MASDPSLPPFPPKILVAENSIIFPLKFLTNNSSEMSPKLWSRKDWQLLSDTNKATKIGKKYLTKSLDLCLKIFFRSSAYDQLLAAEAKAEKSQKGIPSLRSQIQNGGVADLKGGKEPPIVRVQELQGVSRGMIEFCQDKNRQQ